MIKKLSREFNHCPLFFVFAGFSILLGVLVDILVIFG